MARAARRFLLAALFVLLCPGCAMALPGDVGEATSAESVPDEGSHQQPIKIVPATPLETLWERLRAGFKLAAPGSPLVTRFAQQYAANNVLDFVGRRAAPLLYLVVEEVEKRGLPLELALIPVVESGFAPAATSHAGAHGPWQFMPFTGKRFGLAQDRMRDERRAWLVSTRAALSYLQTLHAEFGDWHLAIAAYNADEGRIAGARRAAQAAGIDPRFENLRLPNETREYVPRVFALAQLIATQAQTLTPIPNSSSLAFVPVTQDMDVRLAIRLSGLPEAQFHQLNPAFSGPLIVAATEPELLLPIEAAQTFEAALSRHAGPMATWRMRRLGQTVSASDLAQALGTSLAILLEHNPLPAGHRYRVGAAIFVPYVHERYGDAAQLTLEDVRNAVLLTEPLYQRLVLSMTRPGSSRLTGATRGIVQAQGSVVKLRVAANAKLRPTSTVGISQDTARRKRV
jgi:membrane-bound lytic murein transglycosylase D